MNTVGTKQRHDILRKYQTEVIELNNNNSTEKYTRVVQQQTGHTEQIRKMEDKARNSIRQNKKNILQNEGKLGNLWNNIEKHSHYRGPRRRKE